MTYDTLIADIKKLVGLELQSIRPGANIVIEEVDDERDCLILRTAKGAMRSRPLSELNAIYDELQKSPAVHVDGVLCGSGTSRNQPETILANLPYIEWLKVDNKKHIAYVDRDSHPYGTLRQMPSVQSAELISKMRNSSDAKSMIACVVTETVNESINALRNICGGTIRAISQHTYVLETVKGNYFFISSNSIEIETGVYIVLETQNSISRPPINIAGTHYLVFDQNGVKALIKV